MYNLTDFISNTNIINQVEQTMELVTRDMKTGEYFYYVTKPNTSVDRACEEAFREYVRIKEIDAALAEYTLAEKLNEHSKDD